MTLYQLQNLYNVIEKCFEWLVWTVPGANSPDILVIVCQEGAREPKTIFQQVSPSLGWDSNCRPPAQEAGILPITIQGEEALKYYVTSFFLFVWQQRYCTLSITDWV